jgi:hypothetical protein
MAYDGDSKQTAMMLNVANADGILLCPCCGMPDQFAVNAYNEHGGIIGTGICGACFWEPGFDDDPMASAVAAPTIKASLLAYRTHWISEGYPWRGTAQSQPKKWNAIHTLKFLLHRAPHLAENK